MELPTHLLRLRLPILTGLLIAVNILVFLAISNAHPLNEQTLTDFWVYEDPAKIWDGAYWSLLGMAFVHIQFFHILFNMMWFWGLGSRIELVMGRQVLFALVFFGAIISSASQLFLGQWPCIGASGVVYALFGFMYACRKTNPFFAAYLTRGVIQLLIAWLFLSVVLSLAKVWPIGYAAHFSGFFFGMAAAYLFVVRRGRIAAAAVLLLLVLMSVASLTWLPWNDDWIEWRFAKAVRQGQYRQALKDIAAKVNAGNPQALNMAAWTLATAKENKVRDGRQAITLARQALEQTHWRYPSLIDTLAAAYVEAGDWAQAEATETRALKTLDQLALKETDDEVDKEKIEETRKTLTENLRKIQRHEKIRE